MTITSHQTILYVHSSDEMYGADVILLQLIDRLDLRFFRPIVVLPNDLPFDGCLSKALTKRGILVYSTNLGVLRRSYFTPLRFFLYVWRFIFSVIWLIALIRREGVDIVHSNTLAVIPGAVAAKLTGRRHIWHVHEIITRPLFLWKLTAFLVAWLSDIAVCVSGPTRAHLILGNRRNESRAVVIHNGINTQRFDAARGQGQSLRREWGIGGETVLVGMVGRFSHWKGQTYLLHVAKRVLSCRENVCFAFVGGTVAGQTEYLQDFLSQVKEYQIEERVIVSDFRNDIPVVMNAYDVFVLPSVLPDPFPTVILEAMAMELPVIANAHGGSLEMLEQDFSGLLVSPDRPEAMAEAIVSLVDDEDRRQTLGRNARKRLDQEFSLEQFSYKWTTLYKDLIDES